MRDYHTVDHRVTGMLRDLFAPLETFEFPIVNGTVDGPDKDYITIFINQIMRCEKCKGLIYSERHMTYDLDHEFSPRELEKEVRERLLDDTRVIPISQSVDKDFGPITGCEC